MNKQLINLTPWQPCQNDNWSRVQVKRGYKIELGKMLQTSPDSLQDDEVPYLKAMHVQWDRIVWNELPAMWATKNDIKYLSIKEGDLLVCEGGEVGRAAIVDLLPPDNCIIQNALHLVRPINAVNVRFLFYLLQHASNQAWFDVICNRATIAHFTVEKFKEMWIWIPSLQKQDELVNYLDKEIARIDALIKGKERLLKLLAEKRQATITQAVTRGIDANAPMKDSGVDWLEIVPKHWEVKKLKYAAPLRNERIEGDTADSVYIGLEQMGSYTGETCN